MLRVVLAKVAWLPTRHGSHRVLAFGKKALAGSLSIRLSSRRRDEKALGWFAPLDSKFVWLRPAAFRALLQLARLGGPIVELPRKGRVGSRLPNQ